ncbi:Myb family transcription factor family protein [Striga asiatica]|uniref:Myb family transcription factor family protein n=1 Tax=Striga asiatica TaxID=4170 RepID=A0A5A7PFJ3_STRAF|nr:Myb family transcription factor family protein [Striga asiatica]
MTMTPSEISFDFKSHIYSMLPKSLGDEQMTEQTQKLEDFLARLEEERLKIDAFKRELPLCMQLLTNAMEASRQQLHIQRSNNQIITTTKPILEEFMPLKNNTNSTETDSEAAENHHDKASWMTSAQLWNQENEKGANVGPLSPPPRHQETEIKLGHVSKRRVVNDGGAFSPFSDTKGFPELALASSHKEEVVMEEGKIGNINNSKPCGGEKEQVNNNTNNTNQTQRKARRCWSPDLHRRFVNALHMLGGSQVATPKQIRELMKVDGLTNDEVKSHLQKYRLHTRRPSPSPQASLTAAPQVVVLGGIWVPPEYAAAAAHGGSPAAAALYGAHGAGAGAAHHHVSTPFCSPAPPQGIYPAIAAASQPPANTNYQIHPHGGVHHHQQQQIHLYGGNPPSTQGNGSPESDIRGGDPSESIEDGKSDSGGSWKADSGGERRSRADGEESNASTVVSLKF